MIEAAAALQRSITELTPDKWGWELNRTSTMYLKASGKSSGRVNFPTPITAAAITYPKCGLRKEANLNSGRCADSSDFIFWVIPRAAARRARARAMPARSRKAYAVG